MKIRLVRERKQALDELAAIRSTETGDWRLLKDETDKAKAELSKLQRDRDDQAATIRQLDTERAKLPLEAVEWSELKRQQDLATTEVGNLDQRLNEARLVERISQGVTNIKIIDNPVRPVYPVGPSKPLIIAICALAGGLLAGLLYVLLGRLNPLLLSMAQAQAILPLPIAGVFPLASDLEPGHVYRLRRYISKNLHGLKRIVVVSPGPQTGKTTVVAALARSFAESAISVTAIDANQSAPGLHEQFRQPARPGLRDYAKLGNEMKPSIKINEYLSIVRCGPCPPDLNILAEPVVAQYLEAREAESDVVLYDATGASQSAMYLTLLERPALILVVARIGSSSKESLRLLRSHLRDHEDCRALYIFTDANEADIPAVLPAKPSDALVLRAVTSEPEEAIW